MPTTRINHCATCGATPGKGTLFRALMQVTEEPKFRCKCGGAIRVRLTFDFGLGAHDKEFIVEGAFHPRPLES